MGSEKGPLTTVLLLHAEILGQSNNPPILLRLINFIYWLKQKNTPSGGDVRYLITWGSVCQSG